MDFGVTMSTRLLPALAALLVAVAGPVAAQGDAAAGHFIAVTGDVKVLGSDGVARVAVRNGELRQGDSIVTGANSLAQLRMSDSGALSVRADTQLKLDAYRFTQSEDRDSSFAVSILKGGFRALTGLIARNNRQNYRVSTSAMTIGVRGTHFEVVHVLQPVADAAAGTYNRVYDGTIAVQNRAGASIVVSPGQTVFVALPSNLPPVLVAPPVGIFGRPTPAPQVTPQSGRDDGKAEAAKRSAPAVTREAPAANETSPVQTVAPARIQSAPLLNPIDTPRVMEVSPTLSAPATSTIISPTTTTISPTLSAPKTSTTISPTTTTISPTLTAPTTSTIISPTTTTISPVLTAPTTTTISPVMTAPTTTISPVLTAPTTTTISPVLTAPTTTIQTAPTTSTIIKR
jgi:hypothetical protein